VARTDLATQQIAPGTDLDFLGAAVAVDVANGHRVLPRKVGKTVLIIQNTAAATKVVTIVHAASQDNTDQASTAIAVTTGVRAMRPTKAMVQADGGIYVNYVAGHTGNINALELNP